MRAENFFGARAKSKLAGMPGKSREAVHLVNSKKNQNLTALSLQLSRFSTAFALQFLHPMKAESVMRNSAL
jgi:hypothetical protein